MLIGLYGLWYAIIHILDSNNGRGVQAEDFHALLAESLTEIPGALRDPLRRGWG